MDDHPTILLIEDNAQLRRNLQCLLESPGYRVTTAADGTEGIQQLQAAPFDLVITDLLMPDLDGFQVMDYLRTHCPDTVVVAMTGYVSTESAIQALRTGAYDYLSKPLDIDLMYSVVERALEKARLQKALRHSLQEIKVREEALQASEARYRALAEQAPDIIFVLDAQGRYVFLNPRVKDLLGYRPEELIGRHFTDLFAPESQPQARALLGEEATSTHLPLTLTLLDYDRSRRVWAEIRMVALADATGQDAGFQGVMQDVTRRKEIEEQLLKAHAELERRVQERTAALAQANADLLAHLAERQRMEEELLRARKIESVGVLAAGIAHDFNNFLTGILGNISLAKLLIQADTTVMGYLTEAEKACQRATTLTHQLLTFAKGGAPVRHTVSLVELLHESVGFALHGANIRGDLQIAEDLWPVDVDAGQINQVINNVVLNAVQAMPDGGTIQVRADNVMLGTGTTIPLPEGRYVKITVQDYGCGIPREVLSNIFDPYFTTKAEGSGLGLTTAYAIVTKHDGYISIASEVGVGTTVVIYLPTSQQTIAPAQTHPNISLGGIGRILVMDDEEMIRNLSRALLVSLGYAVECVRDGTEAVAVYQRAQAAGQPFAAVILDYTIPGGMGGLETLARLRAIDPQVVALISSGYATGPVMANWVHYGFSGVVAKPYTVNQLQKALHRALRGEAAS